MAGVDSSRQIDYVPEFSDDSECDYFEDDDFCQGNQDDQDYRRAAVVKSPTDLLLEDDDYFNEKYLMFFWKKRGNSSFNSLLIVSQEFLVLDDLRFALKKDNLSAVENFFKKGINSKSKLNEGGWTPLDYAAFYASTLSLHFILAGSDCTKMDLNKKVIVGGSLIIKNETKILECLKILNEFGVEYSREIITLIDVKPIETDSIYDTTVTSTLTIESYNATSYFLSSIQLQSLIPILKDVPFHEFLLFREDDLEKIGVHQLGYRKEIIGALDQFHRCEWSVSALRKHSHSGKKLSGVELVELFKNLKHQLKVTESTLIYTKRLIADNKCDDPKILEDIENRFLQTQKNLESLHTEVLKFRKSLDQVCRRRIVNPPHLIDSKTKRRNNFWRKWLSVACVTILGMFL